VNTATVIACHAVRLFPGRSNNSRATPMTTAISAVSSPMSLYEPAASGSQGLTSIGCSGIPSGTTKAASLTLPSVNGTSANRRAIRVAPTTCSANAALAKATAHAASY
jgi:hypothetical protein